MRTNRTVRLEKIKIEGFRSCVHATLAPDESMSVLIGPNGAGKTNILQALTLLGSTNGRPRYRRSSQLISKCRLSAEFCTTHNEQIALRSTISYALNDENKESVLEVRDEWRFGGIHSGRTKGTPWVYIPSELVDLERIRNTSAVSELELIRARSYVRQLNMLDFDASTKGLNRKLIRAVQDVQTFRGRISYYSASQFTNPASCPASIQVNQARDLVRQDYRGGREHQRFLRDLHKLMQTSREKYDSYISIVGSRGLNLISNINWKQINLASSEVEVRTGGRVIRQESKRSLVVPTVRSGRDKLSFSQLSEGTLKALALIFYLVTDKCSLLLIEEPEVCVHHGLLSSIIELIKSESTSKQIIFSTHSDFVLDRVKPENVFAIAREKKSGTTIKNLTRNSPAKQIQELKKFLETSGNLGDYWRQGGLEL